MNILFIEPYGGGSHLAFLQGWQASSYHAWETWTFPAHKWKWRMRHVPVTIAERIAMETEFSWDALVCSDMLDLSALRGLIPRFATIPNVVYFHENQLTYPSRNHDPRDQHFGFTNITTALAAAEVWFNSQYHRSSFLDAAERLIRSMPDFQPLKSLDSIRRKSRVEHLGIHAIAAPRVRSEGPLRILWAARWEHDKNPADFFAAVRQLKTSGVAFRLHVVGQSFRDVPTVFHQAREEFATEIETWGFQTDRESYERILQHSDVIVSTAHHEFFGLSVVEAMAAGVVPLLPNRLAYPEIVEAANAPIPLSYDGSVAALSQRLIAWSHQLSSPLWAATVAHCRSFGRRFDWPIIASRLDEQIDRLIRLNHHRPGA